MDNRTSHIISKLLAFLLFLLIAAPGQAEGEDEVWLSRVIKIKKTEDSRYQLLRMLSGKTGYLFMYDAYVVNNDEIIKVDKGEYILKELITIITGKKTLEITIIGKHVLLNLPKPKTKIITRQEEVINKHFAISGNVYDMFSREPVSSATVSINGSSIGTITNRNGVFKLIIPDSLSRYSMRISHIGYENISYEIDSIAGITQNFPLEPRIIPLQEVVIRPIDPVSELEEMLKARKQNYSSGPVYITAFYREGIGHKRKNIDLTEAVLKIYKTGYKQENGNDQVKMIKMRRIVDKQEKDTILTKIKSGIHSTLILDVMKHTPDFFMFGEENPYVYAHSDITVVNNRLANVISFEQNKYAKIPLYKGELFVDTDNRALLEARFEINPEYARKATGMYVEKSSRKYKLTLNKAAYTVSYRQLSDGKYYINHVRGDLEFKLKRKRQLFSSTLKAWFEMVNCKVDTGNVESIPRAERLSQRSVFAETQHVFDPHFWENFNVIVPEEKLKELILSNLNDISEPSPAN